jgi:hypothetical protein
VTSDLYRQIDVLLQVDVCVRVCRLMLQLDRIEAVSTVRLGMYKVVQIWPGLIVCKQVTVCPGHILTTLYVRNAAVYKREDSFGICNGHYAVDFCFLTNDVTSHFLDIGRMKRQIYCGTVLFLKRHVSPRSGHYQALYECEGSLYLCNLHEVLCKCLTVLSLS